MSSVSTYSSIALWVSSSSPGSWTFSDHASFSLSHFAVKNLLSYQNKRQQCQKKFKCAALPGSPGEHLEEPRTKTKPKQNQKHPNLELWKWVMLHCTALYSPGQAGVALSNLLYVSKDIQHQGNSIYNLNKK